MKRCVVCALAGSLVACSPVLKRDEASPVDTPAATTVSNTVDLKYKEVKPTSHAVKRMREELNAKVHGENLQVVLQWRAYSKQRDGKVKTWYGDMGTPPPKFVVSSMSVRYKNVTYNVPEKHVRKMASQWMNDATHLTLYEKGKDVSILLIVGDGGEAWAGLYDFDLTPLKLKSAKVEDPGYLFDAVLP